MLIAQSGDAPGPFSFDHGPPFELKAEFAKEINRRSEVFDDDSYIVHPLERHVFQSPNCRFNRQGVASSNIGRLRCINTDSRPGEFAAVDIRSLNIGLPETATPFPKGLLERFRTQTAAHFYWNCSLVSRNAAKNLHRASRVISHNLGHPPQVPLITDKF
jgi:hypothetical protein